MFSCRIRNFEKLPKLILQKKLKLEIAAKKAAKILGIKKVFFAKFPDNGMDKILFYKS